MIAKMTRRFNAPTRFGGSGCRYSDSRSPEADKITMKLERASAAVVRPKNRLKCLTRAHRTPGNCLASGGAGH
jgi:hypothetical protein